MKIRVQKLILASICAVLIYLFITFMIIEVGGKELSYLEAIKKMYSDMTSNYDAYATLKLRLSYALGVVLYILSLTFILLGLVLYVIKGVLGFLTRRRMKIVFPMFFGIVGISIIIGAINYFGNREIVVDSEQLIECFAIAFQTYQPTQVFYYLAIGVVVANLFALWINYTVRAINRQERADAKAYRKEKRNRRK